MNEKLRTVIEVVLFLWYPFYLDLSLISHIVVD